MDMPDTAVSQGRITYPSEYQQCRRGDCDGMAGNAVYIASSGRIALFTCKTNATHKWYTCIQCKGPGKRWTDLATARRHDKATHPQDEEYMQPCDFDEQTSTSMQGTRDYNDTLLTAVQSIRRIEFGRRQSKEFYVHDVVGNGTASLVARSIHGDATNTGKLDKDQIKFHMDCAHFSNTLTDSQMTKFAGILNSIKKRVIDISAAEDDAETRMQPMAKRYKTGLSSGSQHRSNFTSFILEELPATKADLRRLYLDGTNSIIQNLPHPKIELLEGKVGYVSVIDCLRDFMANGNELQVVLGDGFDGGATVTRLEESQGAAKVYKTCSDAGDTIVSEEIVTFTSFLLEWFDDCEPNSNIKNNRGGVTLKSVTFGQPKNKSNDLCYTYLIAVGPKGVTDEIADKRFIQDLQILRKGVVTYSHKLKENVLVKMDLLAVLADQIARRGATGISLGNGTFAARWGYAADTLALEGLLPSCTACDKTLRDTRKVKTDCTSCLNWDFEDAPNPKLLETETPKDFPVGAAIPGSVGEDGTDNDAAAFLRPIKLTFEVLRQSIKEAHERVVSAAWTPAEATDFLRTRVLDKDTILKVIRNASNVREYEM